MSELPTHQNGSLPSNVAGALAYFLGPITGIAFLLLERENRFVRFHAAQSIVVSGVLVIASIALTIVSSVLAMIPILGWLIGLFLGLGFAFATFGLWLLMMYRAFHGSEWEIPVAGGYARRLVAAPAVQ